MLRSFVLFFCSWSLGALTLMEAYYSTLDNCQSLVAQQKTTLSSQASLDLAIAALLPSPTYTHSYSPVLDGTQLSIHVDIFNPQSWSNIKVQKEKNKVESLSFHSQEQELLHRMLISYFDILSKDKALSAAQKDKKASAQMIAELRKKHEAGLIARVELTEAQAKYDLTLSDEYLKKVDYELALVNAQTFFPNPIDSIHDLPESLAIENLFEDFVACNYQQSSLKKKLSDQQLYSAQVNHQHTGLSFIPKISYLYQKNQTALATDYSYQHQIIWQPLNWVGLAQEKSAKYAYQAALSQRRQTTIDESISKKNHELNLSSLLKQVHAQYQVIVSQKEKLATTIASYDAGSRTIADVLSAQSELFKAEKNLYDLKYSYLKTLFSYSLVIGMTNEDAFTFIDKLLIESLKVHET